VVLVKLSLLKRVLLGVKVSRRMVHFVGKCQVWFSHSAKGVLSAQLNVGLKLKGWKSFGYNLKV
jgi:hypothetical protein